MSNNNNTTSTNIGITYNDTRPIAPNGYLCVFGSKGRLNNKILHNLVGIYMAHHLNRTLLVDPEVSKYYDIDRLSLTTYGDYPYKAAMPIESSPHSACGNPAQISPYVLNHGLNILERIDGYNTQTMDKTLAAVDNSDAWYWLGRPPEDVYQKFFEGLIPRQVYMKKIDLFLEKHNIQNEQYNALHLRHYEGNCGNYDTDLCCPKLDYVHEILVTQNGNINDPLFVANDGQCPTDVLDSYNINTTRKIIMGYNDNEPCDGTECAVLDFELCIHAEIFVGNMKSSGDCNIREWRLARYDKLGMTSVLSRSKEVLAMEGRTKFMTRYILGHWRFRPDCNEIGARDRSKPCV